MTAAATEAMQTAAKTIKQVDKETGLMHHYNIDPKSFEMLQETAELHKAFGTPVSQSVVVRRAIRFYHAAVSRIEKDDQKIVEGYQLLRAAKGT